MQSIAIFLAIDCTGEKLGIWVLVVLLYTTHRYCTKLYPIYMILGFSFWYKKASNAKKESICCMEPQRLLPNLPLRPGKAKKKIKVFLSRQFCVSLKICSKNLNRDIPVFVCHLCMPVCLPSSHQTICPFCRSRRCTACEILSKPFPWTSTMSSSAGRPSPVRRRNSVHKAGCYCW
jgi:hypothetical protein